MGKVPTLSAAIIQSISIVFTSNVSYGDVWHTAVLPPPKWQHISRSSKQWKGNKSGPNRRWVFNCISRLWNVCRRTIAKRYTQFIGCRVFGFMTTYAAPSNQCKLIRYTRRRKKTQCTLHCLGVIFLLWNGIFEPCYPLIIDLSMRIQIGLGPIVIFIVWTVSYTKLLITCHLFISQTYCIQLNIAS